jgi:gas vesicle protein
MKTFKHGLLFGGLLGAGITLLHTTTKGKAWRDQLIDHAAHAYNVLVEELKEQAEARDFSKEQFVAYVETFIDQYADKHKLAESFKPLLKKTLRAQWKRVRERLSQ